MKDEDKTKSQLIAELRELRKQTAALTPAPEDTQSIALGLTRFYFENVSIGIHQMAMDGRILNANPYAAQMLGYTTKELTALSIFDIDPFLSADTMETDIGTLAVCQWDNFETVHLKKDGSKIPVEITSNRVEYGGQQYAFIFVKDISNRKKIEKKLRQNERMLRRIMDIIPSMIFEKNAYGRYLMVNRAIAHSLGMTVDELEGRLHRDVHPDPDEMEQMPADDRRAMESKEPVFIVEESYKDNTGATRMKVTDFDPNFDAEAWADNVASLKAAGTTIIESFHQCRNGEVFPIEVIQNQIRFQEQQFHVSFVQDITERKQSETAMRENEHLLVNILESMDEGVTVLDREFKFQIFNTAMENFTNTPKQEVLGKKPWEVFTYIQGSVIEEHIRKAMAGKLQGAVEVQLPLPHKPNAWFRESSTPLRNDHGEIIGVIEVVSEITRRKQDEEKLHCLIHDLKESEGRFKSLLAASFGGITIHDKGLILECNQGLSEITGYSVDELIGMDVMLLIAEKSRGMVMDRIISGYEKPYEAFGVRKNGDEYPIRLAARNIPYKGKQVRTVEFRDISEQKKAEAELHRLKNYLSNIIDSMPSVLVGVDRDGLVTQWNRQARKATGLSLEKVIGLPLAKVFPRLAEQMHQIETAVRKCRVISTPKVSYKTSTGTCYENITIFPLVDSDEEGAVIRVDDVTEQVRLEEIMIQSEKMLSVGGLAAGMAHEINNPLAGMMQTANVMKSRLEDLSIPANIKVADEVGVSLEKIRTFMEKRSILRMIDAINESGRRMAEIITNMLSFSRKSDAAVSSCDPINLLDRTLELAATDYDLKKQHDFKLIKIVKEYANNLPMVPCEGAKIQQVLLNILRNGAQAMQDQDADRCGTPCFVLRLFREKNMLRIEIQDNGPGMDKTVQSRIFEPFFTTKPVGVGTGLGLSVSYFIITQNHGGTLDVISSPGKGANFIIRLPLEE